MPRLQKLAPDLSRFLDSHSAGQLWQICLAVCRAAIARTGLVDSAVSQALGALDGPAPAPPSLHTAVVALTERLDAIYFDLQEAADKGRATHEQVQEAFRRARAANAVAFALTGMNASTAREVIYEAAAAIDNFEELEDLIDATSQRLSSEHPMNPPPRGRRYAIRAIFWLHALVTAYGVTLALLDGLKRGPSWMPLNAATFYALLFTAGLFPLAAVVAMRGSGVPHPRALWLAHGYMSLAQLIGLLLPFS